MLLVLINPEIYQKNHNVIIGTFEKIIRKEVIMRFRISSIVICFVLTIAFIIVSNVGVKTEDNNESVSKKETSTTTVYTYEPLELINIPKPLMFYQGGEVEFEKDDDKKKETVVTEKNTVDTKINDKDLALEFNEEETDLLVRIGMCEAGGEDVECIAYVMRTVLNRVDDDYFPDTIYDVLYQKGQFAPVSSGWIDTVEPSEKCYEALEMVKSGWDKSNGALYFESCEGDSWHSRNLEYLYSCGKMKFYK